MRMQVQGWRAAALCATIFWTSLLQQCQAGPLDSLDSITIDAPSRREALTSLFPGQHAPYSNPGARLRGSRQDANPIQRHLAAPGDFSNPSRVLASSSLPSFGNPDALGALDVGSGLVLPSFAEALSRGSDKVFKGRPGTKQFLKTPIGALRVEVNDVATPGGHGEDVASPAGHADDVATPGGHDDDVAIAGGQSDGLALPAGHVSFVEEPAEGDETGGPIDWEGFGRALFPDEWFPSATAGEQPADTTVAGAENPTTAAHSADTGTSPSADTPLPVQASPVSASPAESDKVPNLASPLTDLLPFNPFNGKNPSHTLGPLATLLPGQGHKTPLDQPLPKDVGSRLVPTFDKSAEEKCRGKSKGFNPDPDSPTCFLWCLGEVPGLLSAVPRGFHSCCPLGMCFKAAGLFDPLGKCAPCSPGALAPPPPVQPPPAPPVVAARQPGEACQYRTSDVSRGGISQTSWRYTQAASVVIAPTPGHLVFQTQWNVSDAPFGGVETTLDTVPGKTYALSYAIENHRPCVFSYALFVDGAAVHYLNGLDVSARVERAHSFNATSPATVVRFSGYTHSCNGSLYTDVNSFKVVGPDPKTCR